MTDDIVVRLRDISPGPSELLLALGDEAADEIERLRAALRPFANLFLYPDDLGFEASLDIKEDPDWDDDANDTQTENCFVLRRSIKAARTALAGEKTDERY